MASISTDTYSLEHLCALANPKSIEHVRQLGDRKQLEAGLKTNLKTGLRNNEDHSERINKYGNNVLPDRQGKSFLSLVWTAFQDKVLIILSIAAAVSLAVGLYQTFGIEHENGEAKVDWVEGVAIMLAVVIVVLVGSINDYQKEKAFAKLNKKKEDRKMAVLRGGQESQTSIFDLMVGDILRFQTGDILPVDGLLLDGYNVKADESSQTGEIDQMKKSTVDATFAQIASASGPLSLKAQGDPILLSGSKIVDGNGTMIVTAVGIHSTYGSIMMSLRDGDTELTPLQSKLNAMAENIAIFAIASALLYFFAVFFKFIYRITRGDSQTLQPARKGQLFLNVFIESVSIVAVAIPEGLPLAVTLALAIATTRMFKDNNLVRLLASCETMGNASTICSDKTGTLTQNKMTVVVGNLGAAGDFGFGKSTGKSTDKADQTRVEEAAAPSSVNSGITLDNLHSDVKALLAQSIVTNSTASEEGEEGSGNFGGSVTEVALLRFAQGSLGIHSVRGERNNANIQAAIPFNSTNKYMATLVGLPENNTTGAKYRVHVKGAPDILLKLCTKVISRPTEGLYTDSMSSGKLDSIRGLQTNYAERSLRTLCVIYDDYAEWPAWFPKPGSELERADVTASKNNTTITTTAADGSIMGEMTFLGMVGIQDPLREGVPDAVKDCKQAGVVVRMVTGDNLATAKAIAIDSGILTGEPGEIVMEGSEFRKMSDGEMDKMLPHLRVLARAIPEDKRILVAHLKGLGEVVAVTGDGTNDAPALKLANVGFAMGSGTEVAKEASDIILLDDNFASIVKALLWGRTINDAVKKFLQFQLTGTCFSCSVQHIG
jgi:Ca2+-transporting ATPase